RGTPGDFSRYEAIFRFNPRPHTGSFTRLTCDARGEPVVDGTDRAGATGASDHQVRGSPVRRPADPFARKGDGPNANEAGTALFRIARRTGHQNPLSDRPGPKRSHLRPARW